jgi:hypothetical protein
MFMRFVAAQKAHLFNSLQLELSGGICKEKDNISGYTYLPLVS